MKLVDLVNVIGTLNDESFIFIEKSDDVNSDVVVIDADDQSDFFRVIDGRTYHYLIEVFLARDFIHDLVESAGPVASNRDLAERLYEFALRDA